MEETVAEVIPLGEHWNAVVFQSGHVLLHHRGEALLVATGEVVSLLDPYIEEALDQDPRTLIGRTIGLSPDGGVSVDVHGLSMDAILSPDAYTILDATAVSLKRIEPAVIKGLSEQMKAKGLLR